MTKTHPERRRRPSVLSRIGPNHASRFPEQSPQRQHEACEDRGDAQSKKERNEAIEPTKRDESEHERQPDQRFFRPTQSPRSGPPPSPAHGRASGADIESVVGTVGDAIEALHAAGIDHHLVIPDLFVDPHVRGAHRGAGCAALARVGDPDSDGRHPIGHPERRPIGAAVGAVTLGAEHEDHREPAHRKGQNGHGDTREGRPEIGRQEFSFDRTQGLPDADLVDRGPEEHVDERHEGHQSKHP